MTTQDTVKPSAVRNAADVTIWDFEADVVVVGFGCAGACAAIEAAEASADVLVLERASDGGGTSAMSGGLIYMGGGTPVQKACGFDDTPEDMFKFLMAACGPEPDETKIRILCGESVSHFHWLEQPGVPFKYTHYPEPFMEPPTSPISRTATWWNVATCRRPSRCRSSRVSWYAAAGPSARRARCSDPVLTCPP